ncbi:MAG: AbgT family transporter [Succinivibrio sp.]
MVAQVRKRGGLFDSLLNGVEKLGNKLPHITMLFIYALIFTMILSLCLSYVDFDYIHPNTHEKIRIVNMFTPENLLALIVSSVKNFMSFPPLGITIVATLGIGIAEGSGFVNILIKKFLSVTPKKILTPTVILVSILCHIVSDSAYTILMPVSALVFYISGRHPLAGIGCSFAGLAGGFTASFTPSIIDPVMQGFTETAAHSIDPSYSVNVLCNYFYALGGTFFVIAAVWFVTDRIVEPRLWATMPLDNNLTVEKSVFDKDVSKEENRAYYFAVLSIVALLGLLFLLCYPDNSILRAPDGSLTSPKAPVMQGLVPLLFIFFSTPGLVYGFLSGSFKNSKEVIGAMENIMKMLLSFIVFCFFAGQFLYVFGNSNIGSLLAISGAQFLKDMGMPSGATLFGIIMLTAMLNLLITSATSKWAILSTIFVPMLMMLGISPELTQAAFRVSDSAVNVCTPMFPFYPLLILYCQRYCKASGVGTLSSMMLPYTFALLIVLTVVLYAYWFLGIPLGFNSGFDFPSTMYPNP